MFSSGSPLGSIWSVILTMGGQTNRTDEAIAITNKQQLVAFKARLEEAGLEVKLRESRGNNIKAACGQLVSEHNKKSIDELSNVNLHNGRPSNSITGKRPTTNKQRNSFEGKPQKRHPFAKRKKKMGKKK